MSYDRNSWSILRKCMTCQYNLTKTTRRKHRRYELKCSLSTRLWNLTSHVLDRSFDVYIWHDTFVSCWKGLPHLLYSYATQTARCWCKGAFRVSWAYDWRGFASIIPVSDGECFPSWSNQALRLQTYSISSNTEEIRQHSETFRTVIPLVPFDLAPLQYLVLTRLSTLTLHSETAKSSSEFPL